jgi:hypothetical protein
VLVPQRSEKPTILIPTMYIALASIARSCDKALIQLPEEATDCFIDHRLEFYKLFRGENMSNRFSDIGRRFSILHCHNGWDGLAFIMSSHHIIEIILLMR